MAEFLLPDKRAIIEVDDGDYAGAEISVSLRAPMAVIRELTAFVDEAESASALGALDRARELFLEWARPEWNLADAAGPIPVTSEGMDRLTPHEIGIFIGAWGRGVVNPSAPLPPPSSAPTRSPGGRTSRRRSSVKRAS